MRFVVVTGMSGAGKRTAMKMLEDVGFYCVDNLPVPLIEKFVELVATPVKLFIPAATTTPVPMFSLLIYESR